MNTTTPATFPIMSVMSESTGRMLPRLSLPWAMIAPHEAQAQRNHGGQTLARLAERGGCTPCEVLAILEGRRWHRMPSDVSHSQLAARLAAYHAAQAIPAGESPAG